MQIPTRYGMSKFWMDFEKYRKGQDGGHKTILDLILIKIVSIVIPTRYGKSDVIRCVFLDAYYRGLVSCAVILSPARNLQRQIVREDKIDEMLRRYSIQLSSDHHLKTFEPTASGFKAFEQWKGYVKNHVVNGPCIISTTHQFGVYHGIGSGQWLTSWVEYVKHVTGLPPIVFIDECHLGSEANKTGELAQSLHDAGALVVVMTATAYREDGERIPGFKYELVDYDTILHTVTQRADVPDQIKVQLRETLKATYRMEADFEYTWAEAWAEHPSPLCDIDLVEIDITQQKVMGEIEFGGPTRLADLSKAQAQRVLSKVVRNKRVQRYCVAAAIERLQLLRRQDPTIAAIVFVGNDTEDEDNHEAKQVQRIIADHDKSLKSVIATSTTDRASQTIEDFVKGDGDILIVKMMAGLGLDCPRLKIGVDLSPVRTSASYAQRLMRIATMHKNHKVATWITPNDPAAIELFTMLVTASGGKHEQAEASQVLEEWLKPLKPKEEEPGVKVVGIDLGDVRNNQQVVGSRAEWDSWAIFVNDVPEIIGEVSQARLMRAFENARAGGVGICICSLPPIALSA